MKGFFKSRLFQFLPGAVILLFSMVSLYCAADLIEARREITIEMRQLGHYKSQSDLWSQFQIQESWMYWSVFALGLCGFILSVLNTNKVQRLEDLNKEKLETLALLENRMAALEVARDGIFIMDADDQIVFLNKSFCDIAGITDIRRDRLIGKSWPDVFSRSDYDIIEEDILPELFEDGFWVGDFQLYRDDGASIYTEMSLTRLPDGGLIGTVQDASYKKHAEEEKRQLEDQFYQAQKMEAVGRLAGGIAHDFNNILAAMNGYAEFLIDDLEEQSEQKEFAEKILQAGLQARELVDQMLAFSRRSDSTKDTVDIVKSVNETLSMIKATMPKTIILDSEIGPDHAVILGNQTQISQLVMNLCVNGMDAIEGAHGELGVFLDIADVNALNVLGVVEDHLPDPNDTPTIKIEDLEAGRCRLSVGHVSRNDKYIKLSIRDTGTGMSRVIMEHIFEPFFTTKPVDEGTGLGLATVHGVLVSHSGFLTIDSTLGKGTVFDLYFPLDEEVMQDIQNTAHVSQGGDDAKGNGHILLVEDQENVRSMVTKMIERLGYDVVSATCGLEGLDMIRENPSGYDLVVTDHNMPRMTGLEMVNQIHEDLPNIPFILISGYSEEKMQGIIEGHPAIKGVMRKPVSKNALGAQIKSILENTTDLENV
ncbi:MAG: hybrid sensor histidine kinase/response regulator [Alcanivorax sp.]|jgi:PAS domain S-box-containing protein